MTTADSPWRGPLREGISILSDLLRAGLPAETAGRAETLLSLCHLLRFRTGTGCDLPLIGILGSANSGKSTLFNSVAGSDISRVTPIPHQTSGPILAVPLDFREAAGDDSFLQPVVKEVELAAPGTADLSGKPSTSTVVPAWDRGERPFILVDLPDLGTVDSREEHQLAPRLIPWLDRAILMLTEESFAQADHEEIERALQVLHPERARAELFAVLNRRHAATSDAEFESRMETVRSLWPGATISRLDHLKEGGRFSGTETAPLVAESHARVSRILQAALGNLAAEVFAEMESLREARTREQLRLKSEVDREIQRACRFRKAFFSADFRQRLDAFSPWRTSLKRLRSVMGKEEPPEPALPDLFHPESVQRHAVAAAREIRRLAAGHLESVTGWEDALPEEIPDVDEGAIRDAVDAFVPGVNREARKHVEALLTSMQKDRRLKDPLWNSVAAVASTLFLVDLFIPSVGTLGTLAFSGALSALGFSGILTSEMIRQLRTSRMRESFEQGLREILERFASRIVSSGPLLRLDLAEPAGRLARWSKNLPKV